MSARGPLPERPIAETPLVERVQIAWRETIEVLLKSFKDPAVLSNVAIKDSVNGHRILTQVALRAGFTASAGHDARDWDLEPLNAIEAELLEKLQRSRATLIEANAKLSGPWKNYIGDAGSRLLQGKVDAAHEAVINYMDGMTNFQRAIFLAQMGSSAALEIIPSFFLKDKSVVVNRPALGLDTLFIMVGYLINPGVTPKMTYQMITRDRFWVGVLEKVSRLLSLIPAYGENSSLYTAVTAPVALLPIAIMIGRDTSQNWSEAKDLATAEKTFASEEDATAAMMICHDLAKCADNLADAKETLAKYAKQANFSKAGLRAFEEMAENHGKLVAALEAIVKSRSDTDPVVPTSLLNQFLTRLKKVGNKSPAALIWVGVAVLAVTSTRSQVAQRLLQAGTALYSLWRAATFLFDLDVSAGKYLDVFSKAVSPSVTAIGTLNIPLLVKGKEAFAEWLPLRGPMLGVSLFLMMTVQNRYADMILTAIAVALLLIGKDPAPLLKPEQPPRVSVIPEYLSLLPASGGGPVEESEDENEYVFVEKPAGDGQFTIIDMDEAALQVWIQGLEEIQDLLNRGEAAAALLGAPRSEETDQTLADLPRYIAEAKDRLADLQKLRNARSNILPWNQAALRRAGVPENLIDQLLRSVTPQRHGAPSTPPRRTDERLGLNQEVLRASPGFQGSASNAFTYEMTASVIELKDLVVHLCSIQNASLAQANQTVTIALVWGKFDNQLYGAFLLSGTMTVDREGYLPVRNWMYEDPGIEALVDARLAYDALTEQDYWQQRRDRKVHDLKLAHMLDAADIAARPEFRDNPKVRAANFDYRTAVLFGACSGVHSWKCLMSNPLLPARQRSANVMIDRYTNKLVGVFPGTVISSRRTAYNVSKIGETVLADRTDLRAHVIGAGPIAGMVLETMKLTMSRQIKSVTVNSTGLSAFRLVDEFKRNFNPSFSVRALQPDKVQLNQADMIVVIAENPQLAHFVKLSDVKKGSCVIDLSILSIEPKLALHYLAKGQTICDEVYTVSHRNAQSISDIFQRAGLSLEEDAAKWNVMEMYQLTGPIHDKEILSSSSGLASTDTALTLGLAQAVARNRDCALRLN